MRYKPGDEDICYCAFCGLPKDQVRLLLMGQDPDVFICDSCVDRCKERIMEVSNTDKQELFNFKLPLPTDIKNALDEYVIGQEKAKKNPFSSCLQSLQAYKARKK